MAWETFAWLTGIQGLYILPFLSKKMDTNQQHSSFPLDGFTKMGVLPLSVCQHWCLSVCKAVFLRKLPGEHESKPRSPLYLQDPLQTLLFPLQSQGTSLRAQEQNPVFRAVLHHFPRSLQYDLLQVYC